MSPTLAIFVISLAVVLGAYWVFIVLPEDRAAARLRQRLRPGVPSVAGPTRLTRRDPALSALKGLDSVLGRSSRLLNPLRAIVEQSGLPISVDLVLLACLSAASIAFFSGLILTSVAWASGLAALGSAAIPILAVRYAARRRTEQFEDQFPQAVDLIASALRAGHAFTTGVSMVADEVPDPLGAEFRLLFDQQNYGMALPDALKAFARRVPLLDARFFITAVLTQREAGGNLAEVLDNLSGLIRERSRVKRQVRVASAHGRITGWILSAMPPGLAVVMTVVAPDHMRSFVTDPLGVRMIIFAIVLQVIGTIAIRRIVDVEF